MGRSKESTPKGFRKKFQVVLLSRKDFLAVEGDVGDPETSRGKFPSMSRGPRLGGCGTATITRVSIFSPFSSRALTNWEGKVYIVEFREKPPKATKCLNSPTNLRTKNSKRSINGYPPLFKEAIVHAG
jgi:hypothetical protein